MEEPFDAQALPLFTVVHGGMCGTRSLLCTTLYTVTFFCRIEYDSS